MRRYPKNAIGAVLLESPAPASSRLRRRVAAQGQGDVEGEGRAKAQEDERRREQAEERARAAKRLNYLRQTMHKVARNYTAAVGDARDALETLSTRGGELAKMAHEISDTATEYGGPEAAEVIGEADYLNRLATEVGDRAALMDDELDSGVASRFIQEVKDHLDDQATRKAIARMLRQHRAALKKASRK